MLEPRGTGGSNGTSAEVRYFEDSLTGRKEGFIPSLKPQRQLCLSTPQRTDQQNIWKDNQMLDSNSSFFKWSRSCPQDTSLEFLNV